MTHRLPAPLARYFDAASPAAIVACFTDDAVVTDERRTHHGRAAILKWREEVARISFRQDILRAEATEGGWCVTCRVSGDFKGSPVELDYDFALQGDRISRLAIA